MSVIQICDFCKKELEEGEAWFSVMVCVGQNASSLTYDVCRECMFLGRPMDLLHKPLDSPLSKPYTCTDERR